MRKVRGRFLSRSVRVPAIKEINKNARRHPYQQTQPVGRRQEKSSRNTISCFCTLIDYLLTLLLEKDLSLLLLLRLVPVFGTERSIETKRKQAEYENPAYQQKYPPCGCHYCIPPALGVPAIDRRRQTSQTRTISRIIIEASISRVAIM